MKKSNAVFVVVAVVEWMISLIDYHEKKNQSVVVFVGFVFVFVGFVFVFVGFVFGPVVSFGDDGDYDDQEYR